MTANVRIEPRTLRGFRDYLPEAMMPRERLIETARRVYRSYGFCPIDTPALEYLEVLLGKGGDETDKQLYKFEDHGGRMVGMRFDLTVPLARFAAQHIGVLGTPFKRYHIASVWRGENTQRGRYREFMQCDFDTIGTKALAADIETGLVIHDLLRAIGIEDFRIHINHRQLLNGLLDNLKLTELAPAMLRALDKLGKAGPAKVVEEMTLAGASTDQANKIIELAKIDGTTSEVLAKAAPLVAGSARGEEARARLADLGAALLAAGVPEKSLKFDLAIARGLDYYTGAIYETYLGAMPTIGSVCSGGRYDNLAELYTKEELPGIGASLGLDRLLAALEELNLIEKVRTPAPVFIPFFAADHLHDYLRMASEIRAAGIGVELFPDPKKLGQQLKYADKRGFRLAIVAGSDEFASGACQVKDLASGSSVTVPMHELTAEVKKMLEEEKAQ